MSKPWEKYAGVGAPAAQGPWQKYQEPEADGTPIPETFKSNPVEGFGVGGLQGLTLNLGDELMGAIESPKGAAKSVFGYGSEDPDVKKYQRERDTAREAFGATAKQNPVSNFAGEMTGAMIGPGKLLKGATGVRAVATAAGLGAGAGFGGSQADLADHEYGRLALDTAIGGTIGAGMQYGANKLGEKLASRAASAATAAAEPALEATVTTTAGPSAPGSGNGIRQMQRWAKQIFAEAKPIDNVDEVSSAIKTISGQENVPAYMLTRDRQVGHLADSLLKSPTIGGKLTRAEVMPIYEGLEKFGKAVADRAGGLSAHETGEAVKTGIAARFKQMIAPAEAIYEQVEEKFAKTPIERLAFQRGVAKLRRSPEVKTDFTGAAQSLLAKIENTFNNEIQTVADLRGMRTNMGSFLGPNATKAEKNIVGTMYGILTRERDRSILRSATTTGPKIARAGKNMALLGDLKHADNVYRQGVSEVAGALGIEGSKSTPASTAIREYLANTPAEQLVKQLFNKGDFSAMSRIQQTFPEQFKQLKDLAIQDLIKASTQGTELSPQRLSTNLGKYGPEVQKMLLGDLLPQAQAAKLTLGALPDNFNPSKTSTGMQFHSILTPDWWTQNAASLGQRKILSHGSPGQMVTAAASRLGVGPPSQTTVMAKVMKAPAGAKWAKQLQDAVQRGPAAWAATYYVLSKSDPAFRAMLDQDESK